MIDKPEGVEEIGSEHIFQETRDKASNLLYLKYQKAVKKFNIDSGTGYDNPSEQLERVVKFLENNINLRTIANYLENNSDIKYLVFAYQKGDLSESVANLYVKNATDGKGLDEFLTILLKKLLQKTLFMILQQVLFPILHHYFRRHIALMHKKQKIC